MPADEERVTPDPIPAPPLAVAMADVEKSFNAKPALHDLTIEAPEGRITVLLGPNGAGKTTAIRCITGAMEPDAGTVRTLGHDPSVDGEFVRSSCGVVSAKPALYDRLTGRDNLRYAARLHGVEQRLGRDQREPAHEQVEHQRYDAHPWPRDGLDQDPGQRDTPHQTEQGPAPGAAQAHQRERRVGAGDEEKDRGVVQDPEELASSD